MNFTAMHKQRKLILIAAAAGVISVFLPWLTAGGIFGGSFSTNGFSGGGIVVFLGFVGAIVLSLMGDQTKAMEKNMWLITLAAGAIALLIAVVKYAQISGSALGLVTPGYGLWVAMACALGVVVCAWVFKNPGDTLQSGFESMKQNISSMSSTANTNVNSTANTPVGTTTTPPPTPTSGVSKVAELERLIILKNEGKITEQEYQEMKEKIM